MERFIKGDVVIIPFPFSDLTYSKKRPALIIANLKGDDYIFCQITSQIRKDRYIVELMIKDFQAGSLPVDSFIRVNKIFTGDKSIILRKAGILKDYKINEVIDKLISILTE